MMDVMLEEKFLPPLRDLLLGATKQHKMIFVKPLAIHVPLKFRFDIHNAFSLGTSVCDVVRLMGVGVECALVRTKSSFVRSKFTFFIVNDGL